jgi:hypothetical protein
MSLGVKRSPVQIRPARRDETRQPQRLRGFAVFGPIAPKGARGANWVRWRQRASVTPVADSFIMAVKESSS